MKENQCPSCGLLSRARIASHVHGQPGDFMCGNPYCDVRTFRPRTRLVEALNMVGPQIPALTQQEAA